LSGRTRISALVVAVLALALLGCGASSDEEPEPQALSRAAFLERGDRICRDLQSKAEALSVEAQGLAGRPANAETAAATARIWRKQVELVDELKRRFDALGPAPEGEETPVRDFRADITGALRLGRQIAVKLEQGEDPTDLVVEYATLIEESNATAALIGFKVCGQG
jgi:hypothetical protein